MVAVVGEYLGVVLATWRLWNLGRIAQGDDPHDLSIGWRREELAEPILIEDIHVRCPEPMGDRHEEEVIDGKSDVHGIGTHVASDERIRLIEKAHGDNDGRCLSNPLLIAGCGGNPCLQLLISDEDELPGLHVVHRGRQPDCAENGLNNLLGYGCLLELGHAAAGPDGLQDVHGQQVRKGAADK